jgi:hypothetical protein
MVVYKYYEDEDEDVDIFDFNNNNNNYVFKRLEFSCTIYDLNEI